jgi:aspartyl-tRNA synthetase
MSGSNAMRTTMRTHLCGAVRANDEGARVRLGGWVHRSRDLGGILFLDLRDRAGIIQVSFDPRYASAEMRQRAAAVGLESVVVIEGEVVARPSEMRNAELPTGDVEIRAAAITVVGPAETPAIPVALGRGEKLPAEELRLRYRYLDLRRADLRDSLILRHRLLQRSRQHLSERGFVELETPILTRPTPEGARDYLVPSRVHPGEFYALPQSPQLYKQLLMVSGFDRYFQIARCFRDEDLRADRQPEFTQIDIEASFVTPDDIFAVGESLMQALWREAGHEIATPFPRLTYSDAMERFGTDRPDLRFDLELFDATDVFRGVDFGITRTAIEQGGRVRAIRIPGAAGWSRKQLDEIEGIAKGVAVAGAKGPPVGGLLRLSRVNGSLGGQHAKFLDPAAADRLGLTEGDLCLLVAAPDKASGPALDRVRQEAAARLGLARTAQHRFLWVTSFPLFAVEPDGALAAEHHPFTAPDPADVHLLDSEPDRVRSFAYDVVYNGLELASGSIRISDPDLQRRVFARLGIGDDEAEARFGFLLEGLRAGAPPHGGVAFGFDRIAMLLAGGTSLRDVIAFPKTAAARALFEGAPAAVPPEDLAALHIREGVGHG